MESYLASHAGLGNSGEALRIAALSGSHTRTATGGHLFPFLFDAHLFPFLFDVGINP